MLTIPFLAWYLVYIITVKWTKQKSKAVRLAADFSTVLFILSVHFLMMAIWNNSYFWLILLVILLTAALFTIVHYRTRHDIEVMKLVKGIWRFTFFLFCGGYILLSFYGIVSYLLSAFLA
nr:DUF3397 domain-containing protein [Bacillus piscicola]